MSADADVERLMHAIDRDRYVVAHCIAAIEREIRSREWLTEGRGPYEWDDDRYREEFADAIQAIRDEVKPLAIVAWDKSDCTRIEERVNAARLAAREMLAKPIGPRDMIAADIFLDPRDAEIEQLRAQVAALTQQGETTPVRGDEVERVGKAIEDAWNGSGSEGQPNRLPPIDLSAHERKHLGAAAMRSIAALHPTDQEAIRREALEGMPTIWVDPAGKGYPCFERSMTPAEAREAIERLGAEVDAARDAALEEAARGCIRIAEEADRVVSRSQDGACRTSVMGEAIGARMCATAIRALMSAPEKEVG